MRVEEERDQGVDPNTGALTDLRECVTVGWTCSVCREWVNGELRIRRVEGREASTACHRCGQSARFVIRDGGVWVK